MSFSSRLREARKEAGFTQQALADAVGISKNSICNYEKGASFPRPYILYDLSDALHVDPREFFLESKPEDKLASNDELAPEDKEDEQGDV